MKILYCILEERNEEGNVEKNCADKKDIMEKRSTSTYSRQIAHVQISFRIDLLDL